MLQLLRLYAEDITGLSAGLPYALRSFVETTAYCGLIGMERERYPPMDVAACGRSPRLCWDSWADTHHRSDQGLVSPGV